MIEQNITRANTLIFISIASISIVLFITASIVGYSDARKMTPYQCGPIPDSGTIGKVVCCAHEIGTTNGWCTKCDNTHPRATAGPLILLEKTKAVILLIQKTVVEC